MSMKSIPNGRSYTKQSKKTESNILRKSAWTDKDRAYERSNQKRLKVFYVSSVFLKLLF